MSAVLLLSACATPDAIVREPAIPSLTETRSTLLDLPSPVRKLDVAVYEFEDLTGQFKPSENFQTLSRAVSQGGGPVLIKALRDAGDGQWFRVVERSNLNNLLQERTIIQEMRQRYLGEVRVNPDALPPLLFAGVIIEGGVIGYDSNTITGGAGAALLGIGGQVEYRHDTMNVNLRAVSVKTGEVLATVVVEKTILSVGVSATVFRFIDTDQILEAEAGVTTNEPGAVALSRAIEKSLYSLILEMSRSGFWQFQDPQAGRLLVLEHLRDDGRASGADLAELKQLREAARAVGNETSAQVSSRSGARPNGNETRRALAGERNSPRRAMAFAAQRDPHLRDG